MGKVEWSDLRIFLAVAREGTLGAAARKLGQTQPTMGRRLRALEHAVGHTLFQRTADGFVLTDEGNAVLGHAERIEEEAFAFERRLAGNETQLEGALRISSSDWFGTYMLAPVLAEFGRLHPKVCVELLTDARLYSLPRREADMLFRITPFREAEVISRRLLRIPYAVYGVKGSKPPPRGDGSGLRIVTMDEFICRHAGRGVDTARAAQVRNRFPQQQPGGPGSTLRERRRARGAPPSAGRRHTRHCPRSTLARFRPDATRS